MFYAKSNLDILNHSLGLPAQARTTLVFLVHRREKQEDILERLISAC